LKDGGAEEAIVATAVGSELVNVRFHTSKIGKRMSRT
jgi:hypothetical protein